MQIRSATTITIGPTRSEGFEPPGLLHPSVFKTDALGHSANFSTESTGFEPAGTYKAPTI